MTEDRIQQIEQVIAELGEPWTNRLVYDRVGGSYEQLAQYLKQRRTELRQAEPVDAVAVEVDEEPGEPVAVEAEAGPAPLALARERRDETTRTELALALREQRLKQQRHALENQANQLQIQQQTVRSDVADLERRRQVQDVSRQLTEVEAARREVHGQRRAACKGK